MRHEVEKGLGDIDREEENFVVCFFSGEILRYLGDDSHFYEKELPTAKERWGFDILGGLPGM